MRASTSASQARGSTSFSLAVVISVYMAAARSPPRSDPANSQAFLPSAKPRSARSAALFVRQIRPSSKEAGEAIPALEHVVDRLGDRCRARQLGRAARASMLPDRRPAARSVLPHAQSLFGAQAVDVALDIEERVDAPDRLQRERRDRAACLAAPGIAAISASSKNFRRACAHTAPT